MFMPREERDKLIFSKGVMFFVLRDIEGSPYTEDDHKGIQIPA
jgi:hypothetical protein